MFNLPTSEETTTFELPNYIRAADAHNVNNGGISYANPVSWSERLGNIGAFAVTSVLSGINSFYNTGVAVGRFAGFTQAQDRDTADWITSFDSDYGNYYRRDQQAVDTAGFILGAIAPGLGGVKIFHAGQTVLNTAIKTGRIGGTSAKVLGLLVDKTDDFVKLASADIKASTTTLQLINTNSTKALAAGFWQNTLEAAAFESMVQLTMFKSPILQEQDGWDIAKNIALGGVVGGSVLGVFTGAKLRGVLKNAVAAEDAGRIPFQARPTFFPGTSSTQKIVELAFDNEAAAQPFVLRNANGEVINNFAVNKDLYLKKVARNLDEFRTEIRNITVRDDELGNLLADVLSPLRKDGMVVPGSAQETFSAVSGAIGFTRAGYTLPAETKFAKAILKGEVPEQTIAVRFVKNFGDDAGTVYATEPTLLSYADRAAGVKNVIAAAKKDFTFSWKFESATNRWSVLNLKGAYALREAEARYIQVSREAGILRKLDADAIVDKYDIPVLTRAYDEGWTGFKVISGTGPSMEITPINNSQQLYKLIKEAKEEAALHFAKSFKTKTGKDKKSGLLPPTDVTDQISRIVDVRRNYLEANPSTNEIDDLFATAAADRALAKAMEARELPAPPTSTKFLPKYTKVVYDVSSDVSSVEGNVLNALVFYKELENMYRDTAKRTFAKVVGQWQQQFPDIPKDKLMDVTRNDASAGLFSSDSSAYGTVNSTASFVGGLVREMKLQFRKAASDTLEAPLVRLGQNLDAALEFETLNQKITRTGKLFVLREDTLGRQILVDREIAAAAKKAGDEFIDYELISDGVNAFPIKNEETLQLLRSHIKVTGQRTQHFRDINATRGKVDFKDPEVFRPIRPDLNRYPYFAFVVDPKVTGTGHKTMLHAATEKELQQLGDRAVAAGYKVIYKSQAEDWYKARGEFEYSRTLNENYIDSDLANKGIFSNFFAKTDPQKIVDDILAQHNREADTLVTEAVRLRYEPEFAFLEDMGKQYSLVDTSRFASSRKAIEGTTRNPYFNTIKTFLDISKVNEHPLIYNANKLLDEAYSRFAAAVGNAFGQTKGVQDLDKINSLLQEYGMQPAYYDAAMQALVNHTAPRGELTKFVRGANAILSRFTLGLDPLNALNNAIGSNILRTTELKLITDAVKAGNKELAGDLAALAKIKTPGAPAEILSPPKLIAQAIKNFWEDGGLKPGQIGPLMQKYKDMQLVKDRAQQLKLLVDDFTLRGTETVAELNSKLATGFARAKNLASEGLDKAEKLSGNTLAEEFNRFISANVMDQITQLGIKYGILDEKTARTYINTFVNRVEGNIVASQRPLVFQGPIGQAISLFQSYQFNLIQQLLRYVAEGKAKDLAMLAGLQSTLYGMQSLPGFQAMNIHIIGQMSGNTQHRDLYDVTYGIAGDTAGKWILYGIPSNLLQTNIYSRGDVNPRHLTILPTSLQETPIVAGWGKFIGSMYETSKKIAAGGNIWESFLQGLEHNGISRPLAGLAQTLQAADNNGIAYSTSSKGSILYQNDLMSFATLSRLAGGRPLDEALINDTMFRVKFYEAARRAKLQSFAETVKTTLIQGNEPSEEQISAFAARHAELGGRQKDFNAWMLELYKNANVSQADQMAKSLNNPHVYKLQLLMGGEE